MNILYCGDNGIKDGLYISIKSLLKHSKDVLHIYCLSMRYDGYTILDKKFIYELDSMVKLTNIDSFVKLIDITEYYEDNINKDTNFTPYSMLRLYADLLDLPNKLLYLDTDVLAYNNFNDFYNIDNTNYEVVGSLDYYGQHIYKKNISKKDYLNSGVLLLNLDLIKENASFIKARKMVKKLKMLLPDQSAINMCCKKKLIVDRKYNEQKSINCDTVFRHFTTTFTFKPVFKTQTVKPWDIARMHSVLNCYEFDDILDDFKNKKERMKKEIIPIFITIDDKFSPFAYCTIKSLLKSANKDYYYHIHIISNDLSNTNKEKLITLSNYYASIIFDDMDISLEMITAKESTKLRSDYFSLAIFFRIFISDSFPEYKKGIYIDSDTIVVDDISKLYNVDLEGNYLGGCTDLSVAGIKAFTDYMECAVGVNYQKYINTGILLLDMEKLREKKIANRFLYFFMKYDFSNVDPDQAYINFLCKDHIKYLDNRWDVMPIRDGNEASDIGIIHYNLFLKPWHYDNVMYDSYFWNIASATPYYKDLVNMKKNYSDKDKQNDNDCLNLMLKKCATIVKESVTFKTVRDSGSEDI